jgi:hypothetical protein
MERSEVAVAESGLSLTALPATSDNFGFWADLARLKTGRKMVAEKRPRQNAGPFKKPKEFKDFKENCNAI